MIFHASESFTMSRNRTVPKVSCDPLLSSCNDEWNEIGIELEENLETFNDPFVDLQNSSMSQLSTSVDTYHNVTLSEGHFLPVNPETENSVVQGPEFHQKSKKCVDMDINRAAEIHVGGENADKADGADMETTKDAKMLDVEMVENVNTREIVDNVNVGIAMRMQASSNDMESQPPAVAEQQVVSQPHVQHIQIVAIPSASCESHGQLTSFHPAFKPSTIILDSNTGGTFSISRTAYIGLAPPSNLQSTSSAKQTPTQSAPVLVQHLQSAVPTTQKPKPMVVTSATASHPKHSHTVPLLSQTQPEPSNTRTSFHQIFSVKEEENKTYPKPVYSYSCMVALALKNSKTKYLPVNEIYDFMCENFPYFKTAPDGWKNSVRHNLSLNKCFAKANHPKNVAHKKGCLWKIEETMESKMDNEVIKWRKKDPANLLVSMAFPERLAAIERGLAGMPSRKTFGSEDDEESVSDPLQPMTVPLKAELTSTPKKGGEDMMEEHPLSPLTYNHLEQEANDAIAWCLPEADLDLEVFDDLAMDLLKSPVSSSDSMHFNYAGQQGSPPRLYVSCTPSAVRSNLLEVASPLTSPAVQG